jgi:phosphotransferase family enzyme
MGWEPEPDWQPVTPGTSTGGIWLTPDRWVVKRLVPGVDDPRHHAYWRRQAEVAASGIVAATPGLRSPRCLRVDRDPDGITVWTAPVTPAPTDPEMLAHALGRFATARIAEPAWAARGILRSRLDKVARRGGWTALDPHLAPSLRRSCQLLWVRRQDVLAELDRLPQVAIHGDAHPRNLLGREGEDVVAVDWEQFGFGPVGFDLGYLLLAVNRPLEDLLAAYQDGLGQADAVPEDLVRRGAVLTAALTGVSRAAWALTQPDPTFHLNRLLGLSDLISQTS